MPIHALTGARIFDGNTVRRDLAVLIERGSVVALAAPGSAPEDAVRVDLGGGMLAPGFVDLQVNGGGGVLFNDHPTVDGLETIAAAHRRFGTTSLLPTLITSDLTTRRAGLAAIEAAMAAAVPGIAGIHLEGPHLDERRAGVHDRGLIHPPAPEDLELLTMRTTLPTLVTLAPNVVDHGIIERIAAAGRVVACGHSDGTFEELSAAHGRGVLGYTHLFNAMSQLTSRAPGAVGAALLAPNVAAGIIVDGHHVHPANVRLAQAMMPERLFLVSDAMPPVGTSLDRFRLGARDVYVRDGRCTTADGTLAGAALDMATAVRNAVGIGIPLEDALRMASPIPARFAGLDDRGRLAAGQRADLVLLDDDLEVRATWIAGAVCWHDGST